MLCEIDFKGGASMMINRIHTDKAPAAVGP